MTMIVYETGDVNLAEAILVFLGLCFTRVYVLLVCNNMNLYCYCFCFFIYPFH